MQTKRAAVTQGPMANSCPTPGCANKRTGEQVCCRRCWFLLPKAMRDQIWRLYESEKGSMRHRRAVLGAIAFLTEREKKRTAQINLLDVKG